MCFMKYSVFSFYDSPGTCDWKPKPTVCFISLYNYIPGSPRKLSRIYLSIFSLTLMENSSSKTVLNAPGVNGLQQKATRNTPVADLVGFLLVAVREHTPREMRYLRKEELEKTCRICPCRGRFLVVLKEVGLCSGQITVRKWGQVY